VTAFGAFVDIGVHEDGLVHVSQLADRFVKDPGEVVKAGDVVKVRVLDVDVKRKRISLSMRSEAEKPAKLSRTKTQAREGGQDRQTPTKPARPNMPKQKPAASDSALALALSAALSRKT
jgi:uncharacterized protein